MKRRRDDAPRAWPTCTRTRVARQSSRLPFGRWPTGRAQVSLLTGLLILALALVVPARAMQPANGTPPATPATAVPPTAQPFSGDVIWLPDENGVPVPVPRRASVEAYLKFLESQQAETRPAADAVSLTKLDVIGTIGEGYSGAEVATLKVDYQFSAETAGPHEVTLGLAGFVMDRESTYTGDGRARFRRWDPATGLIYVLEGAGRHNLTVEVSALVSRQVEMRKLPLKVPKALRSQIQLTIPSPDITPDLMPDGRVDAVEVRDGQSILRASSIGPASVLNWTVNVNSADLASLRSSISGLLTERTGLLELKVDQRIEPLRGAFDTLRITLPPGFTFKSLEAERLRSYEEIPGTEPQLLVRFDRAISQPVELRWTLTRETPAAGTSFRVSGFHVDRARTEVGDLSVGRLSGIRLAARESELEGAIPVATSTVTRPGILDAAFRIRSHPFVIPFDVRAADAYFTVAPQYHLHIQQNRIHCRVNLDLDITRESLSGLVVRWPRLLSGGWQLEPCTDSQIESCAWSESRQGDLELLLATALRGKNSLELNVSLPLSQGLESFAIPMLDVVLATALPGSMTLESGGGHELSFSQQGPSVDLETDLPAPVRAEAIPTGQGLAPGVKRVIPPGNVEVRVFVRQVPNDMTVASEVLLRPDPSGLAVRQTMQVAIQGEGISSLTLTAPTEQPASWIEVTDADGQLKSGALTYSTEDGLRLSTLQFSEPQTGALTVVTSFVVPATDLRRNAELLLTSIRNATDQGCRIITYSYRGERYRPEGLRQALIPTETADASAAAEEYQSDTTPARIALVADSLTESGRASGIRVQSCVVRASVNEAGGQLLTIAWRWQPRQPVIAVALPAGFDRPISAYWNGQAVNLASFDITPGQPLRFSLDPSNVNRQGTLELQFEVTRPVQTQFQLSRWQIEIPRLLGSWVERTVWLVEAPASQTLLYVSQGAQLQAEWTFAGWRFLRAPSRAYLEGVLGRDSAIRQLESVGAQRRLYVLVESGPPSRLTLRTAHRALVTAVGSILALALFTAWVRQILSLTSFRTMLAICVIGVLLLAFPLLADVMWQPTLLGALLSITAWLVDRRYIPKQVAPRKSDRSSLSSHAALSHLSHPQEAVGTPRGPVDPDTPTRLHVPAGATADSEPSATLP